MNSPTTYSDTQLKERLVAAYIEQGESQEISALRAELYRRGYRWADIVELAIVSLMRRYRLQKPVRSLN